MAENKEEMEQKKSASYRDMAEHRTPTSQEVILSIRKSFRENIKPALDAWNKEVRVIRYNYLTF